MSVLCFGDGATEATIIPSFVNILAAIVQIITITRLERTFTTKPFTISTPNPSTLKPVSDQLGTQNWALLTQINVAIVEKRLSERQLFY